MSIYMEHVVGEEREALIEEKRIDNEINKCCIMLEMLELERQQMYSDAELKVLTEGGTYDDLAYLYSEADQQVQQEKKGVLASIWEAIKGFFKGIFDFLFGTKEIPPKEQVAVPSGPMRIMTAIANAVKGGIEGIFGIFGINNPFQFITGAAFTAGSVTLASNFQKEFQKVGEENQEFGVVKHAYTAVSNVLNNGKNAVGGFFDKIAENHQWVQNVINWFKTAAKWIDGNVLKPISNACKKIGAKLKRPKVDDQTAATNEQQPQGDNTKTNDDGYKQAPAGGQTATNQSNQQQGTKDIKFNGSSYRIVNGQLQVASNAELAAGGTQATNAWKDIDVNSAPDAIQRTFRLGKYAPQSTAQSSQPQPQNTQQGYTAAPSGGQTAQGQTAQTTGNGYMQGGQGGQFVAKLQNTGSVTTGTDPGAVAGAIAGYKNDANHTPLYANSTEVTQGRILKDANGNNVLYKNLPVFASTEEEKINGIPYTEAYDENGNPYVNLYQEYDLLDISRDLGVDYMLEFTNDYTLSIEFVGNEPEHDYIGKWTSKIFKEAEELAAEDLEDNDVITTESSIFGTTEEDEEIIASENFEDNEELKELAALFETV